MSTVPTEAAPLRRRGRPKKDVTQEQVAQALNTSRRRIYRAKLHVAAVERYPELYHLPQDPAIAIARFLDWLSVEELAIVRAALAEAKLTRGPRAWFVIAGSAPEAVRRLLDLLDADREAAS